VVGEHRRDVLEDLRARHRVADLQPADHLGQHVEAVAQRRRSRLERLQLRRVVELRSSARQHPVEAGVTSGFSASPLTRKSTQALLMRSNSVDQLLLERVERRQVDRPDLAQRDDCAALVAQAVSACMYCSTLPVDRAGAAS
jgi:hypothetical protein